MNVIRWEEPPAPKGGSAPNAVVINELKLNPGRWALVRQGVTSPSAVELWKRAGMETQIRSAGQDTKTGRRLYDIYARWAAGQVATTNVPSIAADAPLPKKAKKPKPTPAGKTNRE